MDSISEKTYSQKSAKIVQVLSQMGELEGLKNHLTNNFDVVMTELEKIPDATLDTLLVGRSDTPEKVIPCVKEIQMMIAHILNKGTEDPLNLKEVEKKFAAIDAKKISEQAMLLAAEYIDHFCHTYEPIQMKEWEEDVEESSLDPFLEHEYPNTYLSQDDIEISQREKKILGHCISIIQSYIYNLEILLFHSDIQPEFRAQGLADEKKRLPIAKKICTTLRRIVELSSHYQPYHDLRYPQGPFNGLVDLIIRWEDIGSALRKSQNKL